MKCFITDKTLKSLKTLQENLEEGLVSKKSAALTLKYAIEDIEALELDVKYESPVVTPDGTNEEQRVIVASYEAGGGQ